MTKKVEQIERYSEAFRDLINAKIWSSDAEIRSILRLSKDEDWAFLCVSMDVLEDTCTAISSFLMYGLNGLVKYDDFGEKYLRLYGILSATYIQQQAVLKLYQLMNVPPAPDTGKEIVDRFQIRSLRHKLCSHSTDYYDKEQNMTHAFVPIRIDLDGFNCTYAQDGRGNHISVNLKIVVEEHLDGIILLLDKIMEKAIRTLFKGQESCETYIGFLERLKSLRTS